MARIILLTEPECVSAVVPRLAKAGAAVDVALTLDELNAAVAHGTTDARLFSFGASVIVPARVLGAFPGPSYNLHPGPPAYPGLFPSVYALYDGAAEFGLTLHEMTADIDSGPIVAVDAFLIPRECDRLTLDTRTFQAMLAMVDRLAPALADVRTALPQSTIVWSGRRRTRTDFAALCRLPEDATALEFTRRLRAVGEGPHHALAISRFGRDFRLVSGASGPVVRGGQTVDQA